MRSVVAEWPWRMKEFASLGTSLAREGGAMKNINLSRDLIRRLAVTTAVLAYGAGSLLLASCHTVQGVGQDVQEVGQEIETHTDHGD